MRRWSTSTTTGRSTTSTSSTADNFSGPAPDNWAWPACVVLRVLREMDHLTEFIKQAFTDSSPRQREMLLEKLASALTARIRNTGAFQEEVANIVGELRLLGH